MDLLLLIALALCGKASADPISGAISFNGLVQLYNSSNGATSTVPPGGTNFRLSTFTPGGPRAPRGRRAPGART